MITIPELKAYLQTLGNECLNSDNSRMFNHIEMVVDDSEMANVLQDHEQGMNSLLVGVLPDFAVSGEENNAKWLNLCSFYVLDKTDYSEYDREGFHNIFAQTQLKAREVVYHLLEAKANHEGLFCGFLSWLNEDSISVNPVWRFSDCNGWVISFNFKSRL